MIKNVNFPFYDEYEKMDRRADPDFIESITMRQSTKNSIMGLWAAILQ